VGPLIAFQQLGLVGIFLAEYSKSGPSPSSSAGVNDILRGVPRSSGGVFVYWGQSWRTRCSLVSRTTAAAGGHGLGRFPDGLPTVIKNHRRGVSGGAQSAQHFGGGDRRWELPSFVTITRHHHSQRLHTDCNGVVLGIARAAGANSHHLIFTALFSPFWP